MNFDEPNDNKTSSTNETSIEEIKAVKNNKNSTNSQFNVSLITEEIEKESKQFYTPKKENEFTARIEEISANGVVKMKFSEDMKDEEDGFDISLINPKSM